MNERIRELSEQAEKYADDNFRGEPTWSEAFESKFAQLIIDECIQVAYAAEKKPEGFLTAKSAHNLETEIYTHFGVKQ